MASKYIKGITIEIAGDTQKLTKALEEVNKKSRDLQGELRQVERLLKLDPKNTELLEQKQKLLAKAIENTKEKLETLKEAERQVQAQFEKGEIGEEQYRAIQREVIATEQQLKKLEAQLKEVNNKWKDAAEKLEKFGKKTTDVGKDLTKKVTAPILGIGTVAAKTGMEFEAAMSKVQALSGATAEEMAKLEKQAREMGATTVFSASEAAEAQAFLAMAGYDVAQIMNSLPGLLNLAAAGQLDLGRAADITTNIMSGFNIEAEKTAEVADVLAKAAASANTNVEQMGDAMSYVAPVAAGAGLSLEETAAAIGILSNAGIQGQRAGTALRNIIASLQNPTGQTAKVLKELGLTADDVNPSMHSLTDILKTLEEAGMDSSQAMRLVGTAAGPALIALMSQGSEGLAEFTEQLENAEGAAKDMAATMTDNLQGRIQEMKSAFEEAALTIYDSIQPALEWLVEKIKGLADWFNNLSPSMQKTIIVLAGIAAAIGPLLIVLGQMSLGLSSIIKLIGPLITGLAGATGAIGGLSAVIGALTGPIGIAIAAIAALTAGGIALYKHMQEDSIPTVNLFGDTVSEATQQAVGSFMELNEQATLALNQLSWSGQEVTQEMADSITNNFSQMAEQVQAGLDNHYQESLQKMQAFVNNSTSLSEEEQKQILANMQQGYENRKQAVEEGEARIKEILQTASEEKRALTKEEQEEINAIQREMVNTGIQVLSENELEAKVIMERMKQQAGEISARQAAEVVQNSLKQKEETIKAAEEQYNEVIKEIIRQRDEAGTITAEQADKLIREAKRQRDEVIAKAEEMHNQVVEQAKLQAGEHVNQVDWETGQILSKWDVFKRNVGQKVTEIKENAIETWQNMWKEIKNKVENAWEYMSDAFSSLRDSISNWFQNLINDAFNWGKNLIDGFINGIKSMIGKVTSTVRSVVNTVSDYMGFRSPAKKGEGRYIVDWGANMIAGFIEGMNKAMPELQKSARSIMPVIKNEIINTTQIDYSKIPKGDTIIHVYNPQPSPAELARQIKKAQQELALGF